MRRLIACLLFLAAAGAARDLEVYFVDVEGGQATLVVAPSGESLLIDTGWPGFNQRDANRIAAAAKAAGVKKIDYLVITHYHSDHVGGVRQLAAKLPIANFIDHGPNVEHTPEVDGLFQGYEEVRAKGKHIQVKPGDTIPLKGVDVQVVAAGGETISSPLPGAGQPNPDCSTFKERDPDPTENAQSVGLVISSGDFRMVDLGDLTWNKEYNVVCPNNKVGAADLFVVSHHGMNLSDSPQLVHALRPRVAIFDNGATKGGSVEVLQTVRATPGVDDVWQLHYAVDAPKALNAADTFIANVDQACQGKWLKLTVQKDGSFSIVNARNKYEKTYSRR
ncbi:MAG: MBL fold metallo-hydrolase [Acidobacteriia bacterium]|nr:MBL fold metallo-hydrolase [Terriglobia bacterium]